MPTITPSAISGSQKAITPARSNLARSGATRSGWPLIVGARAILYALSNIARSAATRSNYTSGRGFVAIGGVHVGTIPTAATQKIVGGVTITDALNDQPNRCTFRVRGLVPAVGSDVVVTLGSKNNGDRLFAGQVLSTAQGYTDTPLNYWHDVSAIDWTWGLNQRLVARRWSGASATTIAIDLVTSGAPNYGTGGIAAGLPPLDEFTTTNEELSSALTALAKRIGGYWYVDYNRVVHLFTGLEADQTPPSPLNPTHPTLTNLVVDRDGSPLVTRVYVEAGGGTALAKVVAGETQIPVDTLAWYDAGGGVVLSGPQRIGYTGVQAGGGGSLVGPGAAPVDAPAGQVVSGTGIDAGAHDYAIAYVTAAGESLPGPRLTLQVGAISPPGTAPTIGSQTLGTGPDPGAHSWLVTFLTATGETLAGPAAVATVPPAPVPIVAPTPGAPGFGGTLPPGSYTYLVTFVTPPGESTAGPASNPATMVNTSVANAPAPGMSGNGPNDTQGNLTVGHTYGYAVCWSTAAGQTVHTAQTAAVNFMNVPALASTSNPAKSSHILIDVPYGPAGVQWCHLYRVDQTQFPGNNPSDYRLLASFPNGAAGQATRFTDTLANAAIAGNSAPTGTNTTGAWTTAVPLSGIPIGPTGTTARKLYRSSGAAFGLFATLSNNTTTTHTDTGVAAGAAPPTVNLAGQRQVALSQIPIGGSDVTGRRLYRTRADTTTPFGFVVDFPGNVATTATDTIPDASLGGPPPATATALAAKAQLTSVPIGPSSVTHRKLYRTKANTSALLLLATIADNTTATYTDQAADATLGAAPPGSDTSGLSQPSGSVGAGATAIIVAGAGAFPAAGGWAVIGNGEQVVRYSGISGNTLIGIPASGPGALTASIAYNSSITVAPALTGIPAAGAGAVLYAIALGDDVNQWIQVDDTAAQQLVAQLFTSAAGGTHSGIIEDVIQDRRLSATEARARGRAYLQQRKDVQIRIRYQSRDINSRSGRPVTVNLLSAPYALSATFMIQTVRIEHRHPDLLPTFDVEASSARFSFEDLLRRWRDLPEG